MNANEFAVVITTTASDAETEKIAQALLEAKLAACIQATKIKSFFTWKGAVSIEDENLLLIKCKYADYAEIESCIKKNHSYEVPEVVQLPITNGSTAYTAWIREVTK